VTEYRQVRSDPRQVAIVPEHVVGDIERIVSENDRFAVVAKTAGDPRPRGDRGDPAMLVSNTSRSKLGVAAV
jgi:hypothetical protein